MIYRLNIKLHLVLLVAHLKMSMGIKHNPGQVLMRAGIFCAKLDSSVCLLAI